MRLNLEKEEKSTTDSKENQRIIKSLDKHEKHSLDEDFTYKKPFGLSIEGKGFQNVDKWKRIYFLTLNYLHERKSNFRKILTAEEFISNRGNKDFSTNPDDLRKAMNVNGIYAEVNLSANGVIKRIKKLLERVYRLNLQRYSRNH